MSKSKWGVAGFITGVLAFMFGCIAIFFSVISIATLKKYLCKPLKKADD